MRTTKTALLPRRIRNLCLISSLICLQGWFIGTAVAHKVSVFAWVDGNTVTVESKFSGGRAAVRTPIEVYDSSGSLLLKGETDEQGRFSYQIPRKTEMKIVLLTRSGHRAEWTIPIEELKGVPAEDETAPQAVKNTPAQPPKAAVSAMTAEDVRASVEAALDKKLKPVLKMMAESKKSGPDLRDIIGGIGYIVGLVGLVAYLKYRRSEK